MFSNNVSMTVLWSNTQSFTDLETETWRVEHSSTANHAVNWQTTQFPCHVCHNINWISHNNTSLLDLHQAYYFWTRDVNTDILKIWALRTQTWTKSEFCYIIRIIWQKPHSPSTINRKLLNAAAYPFSRGHILGVPRVYRQQCIRQVGRCFGHGSVTVSKHRDLLACSAYTAAT